MSDTAIASLVTGIVTVTTMIIGFLTLWVKLKYGVETAEKVAKKTEIVEAKLDNNTVITKAGNMAAASAVVTATTVANAAANSIDSIASQLNGKLEDKIISIVKSHTEPILKSVDEIRKSVSDIRNKVS